MRQAIVTKYLGPTNVKGSRVKAWCEAGHITLHWDSSLSSEDNHTKAALALATRYGWTHYGDYVGGAMPGGGYCFVQVPKEGGAR